MQDREFIALAVLVPGDILPLEDCQKQDRGNFQK